MQMHQQQAYAMMIGMQYPMGMMGGMPYPYGYLCDTLNLHHCATAIARVSVQHTVAGTHTCAEATRTITLARDHWLQACRPVPTRMRPPQLDHRNERPSHRVPHVRIGDCVCRPTEQMQQQQMLLQQQMGWPPMHTMVPQHMYAQAGMIWPGASALSPGAVPATPAGATMASPAPPISHGSDQVHSARPPHALRSALPCGSLADSGRQSQAVTFGSRGRPMRCVGHTMVVQGTEARRAAADPAPAAAAAAAAGAGADGAGGERPANELENRFGLLAKLFFVLMILCQVRACRSVRHVSNVCQMARW